MNYYTGIGSRKTPDDILKVMTKLGKIYDSDFRLRSGSASGADLAFEKEVLNKDIYLPWKGFNGSNSQLYNIMPNAYTIASQHHKAWKYLSPIVKQLMARNVHQVLGMKLDTVSDFLICWTPDGATKKEDITKHTGGTGLAISVAQHYNIPIYNLKNNDTLNSLKQQYNII